MLKQLTSFDSWKILPEKNQAFESLEIRKLWKSQPDFRFSRRQVTFITGFTPAKYWKVKFTSWEFLNFNILRKEIFIKEELFVECNIISQ